MFYVLGRNDINQNVFLNDIEKEFPIIKKMSNIFCLFFTEDGQLTISTVRGGLYFEDLSVDDLKQLSRYFFQVAILKHNLDKN